MIRDDLTNEKYGYTFADLGVASRKFLIFECDACKCKAEKIRHNFRPWFTVGDKTFCNSCLKEAREYGIAKKYDSYETYLIQRNLKVRGNNLAKYGVKNVSQRPDVKDKKRETFRKHYNSSSYIQSEEGKKRREEVLLDRWGVKNASQSPAVQKKKEDKAILKYGVKNVFQAEDVKGRIKQHFQSNFNVDNPSQIPDVQKKKEATCLKNNGFRFSVIIPEVQQKSRAACLSLGLWKFPEKHFAKDMAARKGVSVNTLYRYARSFSIEELEKVSLQRTTDIEFIIKNFLDKEKIIYIYNKALNGDKQIRPDFLIEDRSLVIECDGLYWHSDKFYDKEDHQRRKQIYSSQGYTSLFFREDEILNKREIVFSVIRNKLRLITDRIFARKTELRTVPTQAARNFFNANHLMGVGSGKTLGLYHNGALVLAMQYRWKKKSAGTLEISRLCPVINTSVTGGCSKLLKQLIFKEQPKIVINLIDLRYGEGMYLEKFGFKKETEFPSFQWTDFKSTFHRMQFPSKTGYDQGLCKLWDCGQAKYVLTL